MDVDKWLSEEQEEEEEEVVYFFSSHRMLNWLPER